MPGPVLSPDALGDPVTDVLGSPYTARELRLTPDREGEVVATLVSRYAGRRPARRAVLHVHGFCDYFFQTGMADFWVDRGYDFHALDLRKYGRSLRPHQTPNFTTDLAMYYEELDAAWALLRTDHEKIALSAHSTGGLTVPLWVADRGVEPSAMVLNSPWLEMHGSRLTRLVAGPVARQVGARAPMATIPRTTDHLYARMLHEDHEGEWAFDTAWKPLGSFPVYAGWLRAIGHGHARIGTGLDVDVPTLVLCSARSGRPTGIDDPRLRTSDVVLDVRQIRRRAGQVSRRTTLRMVPDAIHDVFLSARPAREAAYAELATFLDAYVDR